jgi:hypothetical protein
MAIAPTRSRQPVATASRIDWIPWLSYSSSETFPIDKPAFRDVRLQIAASKHEAKADTGKSDPSFSSHTPKAPVNYSTL